MKKSKQSNKKHRYIAAIALCIVFAIAITLYYFFSSFTGSKETECIYIYQNDNIDSVINKLRPIAKPMCLTAFKTIVRHTNYPENIKEGRYEITPSEGAFMLFHRLKTGMQTPMLVTIPNVRTMDQMAARLGKTFKCDSADFAKVFNDKAVCDSFGFTKATLPSIFIPDSYEMYWNIAPAKFLGKMKQAYDKFWTSERKAKAAAMKLTPDQVCTIASIVDEETNKTDEKPTIAGLYYNRYLRGMKLQADPTVKFALKDFGIRRILNYMLTTDSPYNTYRNEGLPPGPIRIPSVEGIEAVLNHEKNDYIYMCAKEDFSGYHNFAVTGTEHQANARRYAQALNARGIR